MREGGGVCVIERLGCFRDNREKEKGERWSGEVLCVVREAWSWLRLLLYLILNFIFIINLFIFFFFFGCRVLMVE